MSENFEKVADLYLKIQERKQGILKNIDPWNQPENLSEIYKHLAPKVKATFLTYKDFKEKVNTARSNQRWAIRQVNTVSPGTTQTIIPWGNHWVPQRDLTPAPAWCLIEWKLPQPGCDSPPPYLYPGDPRGKPRYIRSTLRTLRKPTPAPKLSLTSKIVPRESTSFTLPLDFIQSHSKDILTTANIYFTIIKNPIRYPSVPFSKNPIDVVPYLPTLPDLSQALAEITNKNLPTPSQNEISSPLLPCTPTTSSLPPLPPLTDPADLAKDLALSDSPGTPVKPPSTPRNRRSVKRRLFDDIPPTPGKNIVSFSSKRKRVICSKENLQIKYFPSTSKNSSSPTERKRNTPSPDFSMFEFDANY